MRTALLLPLLMATSAGEEAVWFRIWADRKDNAALQIQIAIRAKQARAEVVIVCIIIALTVLLK